MGPFTGILLGLIIAILLIFIAFEYWTWKYTTSFNIRSIAPNYSSAGNVALTLTGTTANADAPVSWVGRPVFLSVSSLGGRLRSSVASVGVGTVTTAPITFTAPYRYVADPSDVAYVITGN